MLLLEQIQHDISRAIFHVDFANRSPQSKSQKGAYSNSRKINASSGSIKNKSEQNGQVLRGASSKQKIGRNDACPCGSGKKYKKCHA